MSAFFTLLKKDIRLYLRRMAATFICLLLVLCGCAAALVSALGFATEKRERIQLGIVDNDASSISKLLINVVKSSDAVKELFDVESFKTEDSAKAAIADGELTGALIFREGYFYDILDGDKSAVRIVLSDSVEELTGVITHFAKTGEKLIKIAESGVMAALEPLKEEYTGKEAWDILEKMEIPYALSLLSLPEDAFLTEELPYANGSVGITEYYLLAFIVFLMTVVEIIFFRFTAEDCTPSLLGRIKSYRIGNAAFVIEKAMLPFLIRSLLLLCATLLLGKFTETNITVLSFSATLLCALLISVFMSSLSVLLSQSKMGISIIFAFAAASLVTGGGLIPISMLPHAAVLAGGYTPGGLCQRLLSPLLFGSLDTKDFLLLSAYCILAFMLACRFINKITAKGGGEK